jgi:hypothetical protein
MAFISAKMCKERYEKIAYKIRFYAELQKFNYGGKNGVRSLRDKKYKR